MSGDILREKVTVVSHDVATGAVEAVEKRVVDVERESLGADAWKMTDAQIVAAISEKRASADAIRQVREAEARQRQAAEDVLDVFDGNVVAGALTQIRDDDLRGALLGMLDAIHALLVLRRSE